MFWPGIEKFTKCTELRAAQASMIHPSVRDASSETMCNFRPRRRTKNPQDAGNPNIPFTWRRGIVLWRGALEFADQNKWRSLWVESIFYCAVLDMTVFSIIISVFSVKASYVCRWISRFYLLCHSDSTATGTGSHNWSMTTYDVLCCMLLLDC